MTRSEFIGKVLRTLGRALIEDWHFQHVVDNVEKIVETYHRLNPKELDEE